MSSFRARFKHQRELPLLTVRLPIPDSRSPRCSVLRGLRLLVAWALGPVAGLGAELNPALLPPPAQQTVQFDRDIRPIFENRCYRCHGPERPKSHFHLDTREGALKGGDNGIDIVPGNSAKSPLAYYVARVVEDMEMPPEGKGTPLTTNEVGLVRAWIDQGALWSGAAETKNRVSFSVEPSFAWIGVQGNKSEFRAQTGLNDGFSGGVEDFHMTERSPDGVKLDAAGRILANQHDYAAKIRLEKEDLGFVDAGYEQFRQYYDDTGGFYPPFSTNAVSLDQGLAVDVGRAWLDVGLTRPHWPRLVLGYEEQFKDGAKSSLAWSDLGLANPAAVYPSYKDLAERAHIFKLDVTHELDGYQFEDNFRAELYDLNTDRVEYDGPPGQAVPLGGPPATLSQYHDTYNHFDAVNAFRVQKQVRDWLLLGGGYLYSRLEGDGGFTKETLAPPGPVLLAPLEVSSPIVLERESHIYNLSSLWGPWEGLTLSAGLQNEWTREKGAGQGAVDFLIPGQLPLPHTDSSDLSESVLQEDAGLRYTSIPFTVLFADARFRQDWLDHSAHDQNSPDAVDFIRETDARVDLKDVRTGFTISPWTPVSLETSYRHSTERTEYQHLTDSTPGPYFPALGLFSGNGYPAFFRERTINSDVVEARLNWQAASWLRTSLQYQLEASDFWTTTDSSVLLGVGTPLPGGSIFAGNYDAHVYSASAILTRWRRLSLSSTVSYRQSRTVTGVNGLVGITPYAGDTLTVISSAQFALSQATDWNLSYSFSHADYRQETDDLALPLGVEYERHALLAGLSHRFGKRMSASLQYAFFQYAEPTSGGARDYTAHGVFASWKVVFE